MANFKFNKKIVYMKSYLQTDDEVPQFIGCDGQNKVVLTKNGKSECLDVAFLVAKTFVPNPKNLRYVVHKDGNKQNNSAENLKWSNEKEL